MIADGRRVHSYGPSDLIAPLVVLDVRAQAEREADYAVTAADLTAFERIHGRIPRGSVLLMDSGWTARWPDPAKVLNFDADGVRRFPGFSREGAAVLVERGVKGLAVDTMSLDCGSNALYDAHKVLLGADVWGLENVRVAEGLPTLGATIVVAPLLLKDGSESPARVFAFL